MGIVIKKVDTAKYDKMIDQVKKYFDQLEKEKENLQGSASFNAVYLAKKYDDFFIDPIVGFILPGIGDFLSSMASLPALYVAMFKLRSFKLSIAILYITVLDVLCGIVPLAGDFIDALYKSNKKACRWIVGFVEEDPNILSEINKASKWGVIVLGILALILYAVFKIIMNIFDTIFG